MDGFAASIESALQQAAGLARYARDLRAAPAGRPATERQGGSAVDRPAYRREEDPRRLALVVGVERYTDLPEARFAAPARRACAS